MKANNRLRAVPLLAVSLLAALALAACAAPPKAPPPAPPPPPALPRPVIPPPLPAPPANWLDAPATPGTWFWGIVAGRSTATFGQPGMAPLATLTCDRLDGTVLLARAGNASEHVPMSVSTSTGTRPLLSEPLLSPPGWIATPLHPTDPILDAIAFSRGRFALEAMGQPPLYLPSWPEVSRVIEDCR